MYSQRQGSINLQKKLQEYQLSQWYIFKLYKGWFENLGVGLELWAHNNNLQRPFQSWQEPGKQVHFPRAHYRGFSRHWLRPRSVISQLISGCGTKVACYPWLLPPWLRMLLFLIPLTLRFGFWESHLAALQDAAHLVGSSKLWFPYCFSELLGRPAPVLKWLSGVRSVIFFL